MRRVEAEKKCRPEDQRRKKREKKGKKGNIPGTLLDEGEDKESRCSKQQEQPSKK